MSSSSSGKPLRFALVAHDARKDEIVKWVGRYREKFALMAIYSTGTTDGRIAETFPDLNVTPLKSGPLGGHQQIGAMICDGRFDALIFFVDPLSPMPHDVDVKALTRLATIYDLPMACSASTADLIVAGMLGAATDSAA